MSESDFDGFSEGEPTSLQVSEGLASYKDNEIDEADRLSFAKWILFYLFLLVVLVFVSSYALAFLSSDNEELTQVVNTILDITKTAVPSIVTLVLGFYFGRKE
jgi:heme/copper-type cytochrome/quinol oxidase subunit 2